MTHHRGFVKGRLTVHNHDITILDMSVHLLDLSKDVFTCKKGC